LPPDEANVLIGTLAAGSVRHLYERAVRSVTPPPALRPIWHLDARRTLFVGPLRHNAMHAHSVPVFLAGLYEPFRLRFAAGDWLVCRTAVVPAGRPYEFDVAGAPLAVLYLEPTEARADALAPLATGTREQEGALIGTGGELSVIRDLYETSDGGDDVAAALDDLLAFARPRARRDLDARIAHALTGLVSGSGATATVRDAARAAGLSVSHFQHLFAREVGVPFRRFRIWQRLRVAIGAIASASSFTEAAYAAGFADQAHFANAFRRTFGAPASPSLRNVRRAHGRRSA